MTRTKCRKSELLEQMADIPAEVKGKPVMVTGFVALVCQECGYKTIHGSQMQEYMRAASGRGKLDRCKTALWTI